MYDAELSKPIYTRPGIVCTLGTTTDSKEVLEGMIEHGMACARINTAYATIDEYQARVDALREVAPIPIMMDLKGPQVRLEADHVQQIQAGDRLYFGFGRGPLRFTKDFYGDIEEGDIITIENGTIQTRVTRKQHNKVSLEIVYPGEGSISKCMGVNVPGKYLRVPRLSEKDLHVIDFSLRNDVEYLALSFVRDWGDISFLKKAVDRIGEIRKTDHLPGIIAKIEDPFGVKNLSDIIDRSQDAGIDLSVMVARGDLFVEFPQHELPFLQEKIIRTCKEKGVHVITATGILESLQYCYEAQRAEILDVYTAIKMGSDALMFSGETSNGHDPVFAVKTLKGLIDTYMKHQAKLSPLERRGVNDA